MKKLSKNTKTLIYSTAGLAVLIAVALALFLTAEKPEDGNGGDLPDVLDNSHLIFTDFNPSDVVSVSVKNPLDEYVIEQLLPGDFGIAEMGRAPRDIRKLENAARYTAGFKARNIVSENETDFEQFGLDEASPRARIDVIFKNGETMSLLIGDVTPTTEPMTYVRRVGGDTVYAVSSYFVNQFKEDRRFYVSLQLKESFEEAGSPEIQRLTVTQREQDGEKKRYNIELINRASETDIVTTTSTHKLTEPFNVDLDFNSSIDIIFGLFGLTADEVAYASGFGEKPSDDVTGFDNPLLTVEMTVRGETSTFVLGNYVFMELEEDEAVLTGESVKYYAIFSEHPDVIYFFHSGTLIPWYNIDINRIITKSFIMPFIFALSDFTLETAEHKISIEIEGDNNSELKIRQDGVLLEDPAVFQRFYQYIISAGGDRILESTTEEVREMPFLARFTYSFRGDKEDSVIEFYNAGNERFAAISDGVLFTGRMAYILRLMQNIENYLNGEQIILTW